ncbi:Inorganic pyrophospatase PpaX [Anaerovibrio sp. JC8]|uniref:HAD family hydrolase n=1 Tax=Anaerovibrio sp. JC8 TaxID=1240085 RepID=UPI000A0DD4A2|nr:HAD family hydrolase [Anaerovibrio sp. JC8]ORU01077.1 Inorganic pyrophospatase PpaX [Anaerovibrio sp. JC8]
MKYKYYFFDFDYTLVNSEKGIVGCFIKTLEELNLPQKPWDEMKLTIGMPMLDAITRVSGITDLGEKRRFLTIYKKYAAELMTPNTEFFPDTIATLEKLKAAGCTVGIISTKTRHRIEEKFQQDGYEHLIDFIIGSEDTTASKPDPQGINMAIQRTGAALEDIIYVGDSLYDAGAAQNAGVDFAAVLTGNTVKEAFAPYPSVQIVNHLSELE